MTKEELLKALLAERYDNRWWTTKPPAIDDSDVATARRRRAMADDFDRPAKEATG